MDKKANISAICAAVLEQKPTCYHDVCAHQYKSIVYLTPGAFDYEVQDIVAISERLTHKWDAASVTSPDLDDMYNRPRMVISVSELLSEFIVEGECWGEE